MGIGTIKIKQCELRKARMILDENKDIDGEIVGDYFVKINGRESFKKFIGLIDNYLNIQPKKLLSTVLLIPSDKCASERTKLKDKLGEYIYIGDVVEWNDTEGKRTAVVISENGKIAFYCFKNSRPNWAVGYKFKLENFIYADTQNYLKIVREKQNAKCKII